MLPPETPRWPPPAERAGMKGKALADLQRQILEIRARVDFDQPAPLALVDALVRKPDARRISKLDAVARSARRPRAP